MKSNQRGGDIISHTYDDLFSSYSSLRDILNNKHLMDQINFLRAHQTQIRELNKFPSEVRNIREIYKYIQPFLKELEMLRRIYTEYLKLYNKPVIAKPSFTPSTDEPFKPQEFKESINTRGPPQFLKKITYSVFDFIGTYTIDVLEFLVSWCVESTLISYHPDHDFLISFIVFSVFFVLKYIESHIENCK